MKDKVALARVLEDAAVYEVDYGWSGESEPYRYVDNWPEIAEAALAHIGLTRFEQRVRYEPVEPLPEGYRLPKVKHPPHHQSGTGILVQRYVYWVEGDPIMNSTEVPVRQITQRRYVTEWEDVDGAS